MRIGAETLGFSGWFHRMDDFIQAGTGHNLMPVAVAMANVHTTHAKQHAPVDTGTLMRSIHVEPGESGATSATARSGTDVEYAIYQEHGTRFQSGTPFMRPAMDEIHEEVRDEALGVWRDLIGV